MRITLVVLLLILGAQTWAEDTFKPVQQLPKGDGSTPSTPAAGSSTGKKAVDDSPTLDIQDRGAAQAKAAMKSFSGVVLAVREGDRVEVVFKTGDIFYLPHGSKQAAIFDVVSNAENTGVSVSITYDSRTNVIDSASGGGSSDGPPPTTPVTPSTAPGMGAYH